MSGPAELDMSKFMADLAALEQHVPGAGARGLLDAAEFVMAGAQRRCPVRTGALIGSGTVDDSGNVGPNPVVTIGFNTAYAALVHEDLSASHDQGEAKFLEKALREDLPRAAQKIADEVEQTGLKL